MNWLQFFLWVSGIYAVYYLVVLLMDLLLKRKPDKPQQWVNELSFAEIQSPVLVSSEPEKPVSTEVTGLDPAKKSTSAIIGSGGVLLKELFSVARKESIIYTGQVSY